jgi:HD-GYP domain-containing protein (c-di-GMP phosphodiesterase class II)
MPEAFLPVRISTLRGDQKISFDTYVRVADKYILFCRAGDSFEGDRLKRFDKKKVQLMFIREVDKPLYEKYVSENVRLAFDASSGKPIEERAEIAQGLLQSAAEDLIENLDDEVKYKLAVQGAQCFLQFITSDSEALRAILRVKQPDGKPPQRGVTVSALALAIADELGMVEERGMEIDYLTLGCMIQELEHKVRPFEHSYPKAAIDKEKEKLFIEHTIKGADRLKESPFIDPLVEKIVRYHAEKPDGSGPYGKKVDDLDPFIFVASAASAFDKYVSQNNMPTRDALRRMLVEKMGIIPLDTLKGLQDALKKRGLV